MSFYRCRTVISTLLFLTIALILVVLYAPEKTVRVAITHDFGIGFDLTDSYGTVAVSYPNGSIESIGRVEGDAKYREMMFHLSLESSWHIHQPYANIRQRIEDIPRQIRRNFRKRRGLPASEAVGILSNMISALQDKASTFVGEPVTAAMISIPHLWALYGEDTMDAFEYLGLTKTDFFPFETYYAMHSTNAVYAGHNRGLCSDYTRVLLCWKEEQELFPYEYTLAISYTNRTLAGSLARFRAAKYVDERGKSIDFQLGYDYSQDPRDEARTDDSIYWEKVRAALVRTYISDGFRWNVTKVLLWGEAANELKFREVLREMVDRFFGELEFIDDDPVYSGAKGAAEFSKRAIYASREQNKAETEEDL